MKVNTTKVKQIIKEIYPAKLVAATKYVGIEEIHHLEQLGVTIFGENRVQSLLEKYEQYKGNGEFHMIGTLQTNKVKYIIDKVSLIHSVDRVSLVKEIQKQAKKHNLIMPILIQVNIAEEKSKHGFHKSELLDVFHSLEAYPNIKVKGLMMMAPNEQLDKIEIYFKETRNILEQLQNQFTKYECNQLSMGMSNDYKIAIKYDANLIRIGSALFN